MLLFFLIALLILMFPYTLKRVFVIMWLCRFKYKLKKWRWRWLTCKSCLHIREMPLVQLPVIYWILPSMIVLLLMVVDEAVAALLIACTHLALSRATLPMTMLAVGTVLLEVLVVVTAWPRLHGGLVQGGPQWLLLLLLLLVGHLLTRTLNGCSLGWI